MNEQQRGRVEASNFTTRFLYRVATSRSRGGRRGNTRYRIDPLAGCHFKRHGLYYDSVFFIPWDLLCDMIWHHEKWRYAFPSGFSSWTPSLLEALAHAVRKKKIDGQDDVLIYVLDTWKIRGEGRVFNARKLMEALGLDKIAPREKSGGKYLWQRAAGEYLIYGKLESNDGFTAVGLDELENAGLSQWLPRLYGGLDLQSRYQVFQRIIKLRSMYWHNRHKRRIKFVAYNSVIDGAGLATFPMHDGLFPMMRRLGRCWGPGWEANMALAFACLRRRDLDRDKEALHKLINHLDGLPLRMIDDLGRERRMGLMDGIEEHAQYIKMLHALQNFQEGRSGFEGA